MRFINTKTHAINDYIFGVLLIVIPLAYRDTVGGAAVWVPVAVGALLLLQSLITDYEISLTNIVPVKAHLGLDALSGIVLAASPWLFDFADIVWAPHLIVGLIEIGFALTTHLHRTEPAHTTSHREKPITTV